MIFSNFYMIGLLFICSIDRLAKKRKHFAVNLLFLQWSYGKQG